jgi:hypothetical protein
LVDPRFDYKTSFNEPADSGGRVLPQKDADKYFGVSFEIEKVKA